MIIKTKISRRKFLKTLGVLSVFPSFIIWFESVRTHIKINSKNKKITLPLSMDDGISFVDDLLVQKSGEKFKIFSSKCTHLGCKINQLKNNKFICPCHGSQFAKNGEVIKGPATRKLEQLDYTVEKRTGKIIVYVG